MAAVSISSQLLVARAMSAPFPRGWPSGEGSTSSKRNSRQAKSRSNPDAHVVTRIVFPAVG